jgi:hypothetical protein
MRKANKHNSKTNDEVLNFWRASFNSYKPNRPETASQIAKNYQARSLKAIADFHGVTTQTMRNLLACDSEKFHLMCWEWAKVNSPYASFLRMAFIDGAFQCGLSGDNASNLATMKGYCDADSRSQD